VGYETDFSITMDKEVDIVQLVIDLGDISGYDGWFDPYDDGHIGIGAKWYEYKDNMKEISKQYKDVLFTVDGCGEESGDIWKAYFKNGKCKRSEPTIIFSEFNEDELT
jgi:hypothetical protein